MKKLVAIIVILILLGLLGWQVYERISTSGEGSGRGRRGAAVAVEVASIHKGTIRDIGSFTGSLEPKSQFVIAPKISGRLEKLMVNIGDHLKRGQLIAVLDDEEYKQQVEQVQAGLLASKAYLVKAKQSLLIAQRDLATERKRAQAALEATEARYKDATSKSERQKQLLEKKLVSQEEYETAQTIVVQAFAALEASKMQVEELGTKEKALELKRQDVALAEADVTQKEAALKSAQIRLSYAQIRASWQDESEERVVGERFVHEGAMLAPNAPIVSILNIHPLTAVIHVIERDYQKIIVGQDATVTTDALRDKSFTGKIVRVAPLLKETSRQARVEIDIPNPQELLKPGMFVRVQIKFAEHSDVTIIPLSSLARRNDSQGVFRVDPKAKVAKFIPVELGITDFMSAEILSPPLSGIVVTMGHHLLEDGNAVILPKPDSRATQEQQGSNDKPAISEEGRPGGHQ